MQGAGEAAGSLWLAADITRLSVKTRPLQTAQVLCSVLATCVYTRQMGDGRRGFEKHGCAADKSTLLLDRCSMKTS